MEKMLLTDSAVSPTTKALESSLGKSFAVYQDLMQIVTNPNYNLTPQWNYYKDGKAWLCKVQHKKKTVFWLSVWQTYFKIAFYFTAKNCKDIYQLEIDENIKKSFATSTAIGKLIPLVLCISKKGQLKDALKIIDYKKSLT